MNRTQIKRLIDRVEEIRRAKEKAMLDTPRYSNKEQVDMLRRGDFTVDTDMLQRGCSTVDSIRFPPHPATEVVALGNEARKAYNTELQRQATQLLDRVVFDSNDAGQALSRFESSP